ncbi:hypothetical protein [Streptomyces venezuelae]|uniref:hypothetical protein n=1 Tax=Streptomyces venezuelae TaxID=54571 RepID=UPI00398944A8
MPITAAKTAARRSTRGRGYGTCGEETAEAPASGTELTSGTAPTSGTEPTTNTPELPTPSDRAPLGPRPASASTHSRWASTSSPGDAAQSRTNRSTVTNSAGTASPLQYRCTADVLKRSRLASAP